MTVDVELACLASGSDGNALVVRHKGTCVLMDCGLGAAQLGRRLALVGLCADEIGAVFVSHEHGDHVSGLERFARHREIPVYMTRGTAKALGRRRRDSCPGSSGPFCPVRAGEPLWFDGLEVLPFRISHDAAEPVGFRFQSSGGVRLGIVTDTGTPTPEAVEALAGCQVLGLEANHCVDLLARGPYPRVLKRRILSDRGHLSNRVAAGLLAQVAGEDLGAVVALHLSKVNNTPALAVTTLSMELARLGLAAAVHAGGAGRPVWLSADLLFPPHSTVATAGHVPAPGRATAGRNCGL